MKKYAINILWLLLTTPNIYSETNQVPTVIKAPDFTQTIACIASAHYLTKKPKPFFLYTPISELVPLLKRCSFLDTIVTTTEELPVQAQLFDVSCALSQPRTFSMPILIPDQSLVSYWHAQLPHHQTFNVGIAFSKEPTLLYADICTHFAHNNHILFYSLKPSEELNRQCIPSTLRFINLHHRNRYETYAALIKNLDLIITHDLGIAYMAAALAKPVWFLTSEKTTLLWQDETEVWYPTMRIWYYPAENDAQLVSPLIKALEPLLFKEHK